MKRKGFTLIELLVVIAIIGLLSTLAVTALGGARKKARDARRLSDIKQIQTSLELSYTDQNAYPVDTKLTTNHLGVGEGACLSDGGFGTAGCANAYMAKVPTDPNRTGNDAYYKYHRDSTTSYHLIYTTEATSEVGVADEYHAVPGEIGS